MTPIILFFQDCRCSKYFIYEIEIFESFYFGLIVFTSPLKITKTPLGRQHILHKEYIKLMGGFILEIYINRVSREKEVSHKYT